MATTYSYKNLFGNQITNNQVNNLKEYFKDIYIDGMLKKTERIESSMVVHTYYYLNGTESIYDLLPLFRNKKVSFYNVSTINNYKIEDIYAYDNGILVDRSKSIANVQDKIICYQGIDIVTGLSINNDTRKYYYENNTLKYTFEYDENGDCFIIYDETDDQKDIFAWEIGQPDVSFTWQGFEYYEFAEPIIPQ